MDESIYQNYLEEIKMFNTVMAVVWLIIAFTFAFEDQLGAMIGSIILSQLWAWRAQDEK